jgi:hypothetical protein
MNNKKSTFEKRNLNNGKPNPKYVDLLEVDKPIAAQTYGCFSFITPEKILKQKEMFFFEEFLKKWDFSKSMEKYVQFLNFISYKYKVSFEDMMKDYEEFIIEEKASIISTPIEGDYKTFLDNHEEELEKKFNIQNNFQTCVRGFKSRGNFATQEEAELRAKLLREKDPYFDIFVGPVGQWLCWDPEAYKTGKTEYMEEELNQLMQEKVKNETFAKNAFEQRVKDSKKKAIEDNQKAAEKSGNTLTQTIDENGNLISIQNTQEDNLQTTNDTISVSDIRSELFEGENIVVGKTDYGQSQLKSGPFASP